MKREYGSWKSAALGRPMEFLWFGDRGRPVLFFPTSMGTFYQNEDFGAYHAANLAARYPGVVTKAICFSGLYDVYQFLDGYWDDTCYYHTPMAYIANMDDGWKEKLRQVDGVAAPGENDSLARQNREFAALLERQGQRVWAEFWPGVFGHDWPFWKEHIRRFI